MKLVECPVCDSKFDIEKVPNGTKLKCGKCKKVFGVVEDGEVMPIFEEPVKKTTTVSPKTQAKKEEIVYTSQSGLMEVDKIEKDGYEEVIIKRHARGGDRRGQAAAVSDEYEKTPRLEPVLYVGALVAIFAIFSLFYILSIINKPLPEPALKKDTLINETETKNEKKGDDKGKAKDENKDSKPTE